MGAREADPLDAVYGVDGTKELAELCSDVGQQIASPRVDVLPEERHLSDALACQPLDFGQDLARPPANLAPAHCRDDAVRADGVTAHGDLHPRLRLPLAVVRQFGGKRTRLTGAEP